jgi:hypothetical protein
MSVSQYVIAAQVRDGITGLPIAPAAGATASAPYKSGGLIPPTQSPHGGLVCRALCRRRSVFIQLGARNPHYLRAMTDAPADPSDRYVQCMVKGADGEMRPLFPPSADGTVSYMSLDGDFPLRLRPLKLNLPPPRGTTGTNASCAANTATGAAPLCKERSRFAAYNRVIYR